MENNRISAIRKILNREDPRFIVNAPNYWQWFAHQKNHGLLPDELKECNSQLDMINTLGLDVFSRNILPEELLLLRHQLLKPEKKSSVSPVSFLNV